MLLYDSAASTAAATGGTVAQRRASSAVQNRSQSRTSAQVSYTAPARRGSGSSRGGSSSSTALLHFAGPSSSGFLHPGVHGDLKTQQSFLLAMLPFNVRFRLPLHWYLLTFSLLAF